MGYALKAEPGRIVIRGTDTYFVVSHTGELPRALAQRDKPVLIANEELERRFSRLEQWQSREGTHRLITLLAAGLLALAITLQYKLELGWQADWKLGRTDGKVILTPREK